MWAHVLRLLRQPLCTARPLALHPCCSQGALSVSFLLLMPSKPPDVLQLISPFTVAFATLLPHPESGSKYAQGWSQAAWGSEYLTGHPGIFTSQVPPPATLPELLQLPPSLLVFTVCLSIYTPGFSGTFLTTAGLLGLVGGKSAAEAQQEREAGRLGTLESPRVASLTFPSQVLLSLPGPPPWVPQDPRPLT